MENQINEEDQQKILDAIDKAAKNPPRKKIPMDQIRIETLFKAYIQSEGIDPRKLTPARTKDMRRSHYYGIGQLLSLMVDHIDDIDPKTRSAIFTTMLQEAQIYIHGKIIERKTKTINVTAPEIKVDDTKAPAMSLHRDQEPPIEEGKKDS